MKFDIRKVWLVCLSAIALLYLLALGNLFRPVQSKGVLTSPAAVVDGRPVYVIMRSIDSGASVNDLPAWRRWSMEVVFEEDVPSESDVLDITNRWIVHSIDEPYRFSFRQPDGTMTKPLPVQWKGLAAWTDEGQAIEFISGSNFLIGTKHRTFGNRLWNKPILWAYWGRIFGGCLTLLIVILISFGLLFFVRIMRGCRAIAASTVATT